METAANDKRFARYKGIVSPDLLRISKVGIVGVGAVGAQIARMLATMGVGYIDMWDHDVVSEENLGTQGWNAKQVGQFKTFALADDLAERNPGISGSAKAVKFPLEFSRADMPLYDLFVPCVDSMADRLSILEAMQPVWPSFVIDTRMASTSCTVICAKSFEDWRPTWFGDNEASSEPCTARSTVYCAMSAAFLAVHWWIQHLRGARVPLRTVANWPTGTLITENWYEGSGDTGSDTHVGIHGGSGGSVGGEDHARTVDTPASGGLGQGGRQVEPDITAQRG